MPRVLRAVTTDIGAGRYPRSLLVATASWMLLGILLLISRVGIPESTEAEQTDAATGVQAVRAPGGDVQWFTSTLPWLGVAVLVGTVLLFLGFGMARLALVLLGLLAFVGLAASTATAWFAIPAAVFFVVGGVSGLMVSAHRYLTRPRTAGEHPSPRAVA